MKQETSCSLVNTVKGKNKDESLTILLAVTYCKLNFFSDV